MNHLAFSIVDADRNGTLDRQEVEATAREMGYSWLRSSHIDRIVQMGDTDGDGMIDMEEFVKEAPLKLKHRLADMAGAADSTVSSNFLTAPGMKSRRRTVQNQKSNERDRKRRKRRRS